MILKLFRKLFFLLSLPGSDYVYLFISQCDFFFFLKWFFSWEEVVILFFTFPEVILKHFPEVFFCFIHDQKWLFVYLFISQSDFFSWQEVVILFFTLPEVLSKIFLEVFFLLFMARSDYLFISQSNFFHDRKWLFCFLHYRKWF